MFVKKLEIVKYDLNGWHWQGEDIIDPNWQDIETALDRLDRHCYPFIGLYINPDTKDEYPDLNIVGGNGAYFIDTNKFKCFFDDTKTHEIIKVWTSDQGFEVSAKNCCDDLKLAKDIVKYFCDTGELYPTVCWKDDVFKS